MSYKRILNSDEKKKQKRTDEEKIHVKYQDYKDLWLEKGPIWFAENVLTSPPDIPIHPDFVSNNNPPLYCEGCRTKHPKFRVNGVPYHIILSEDQKTYLSDIWSGKALLTLLAAGRGGGKTFIFAVRYTWLLATQSIGITYMGGSMKQSKLCQDYIDNWRYDNDILYQIIDKSNHGVERYMTTIWRGHLDFSACSPTSARGPHVNEVGLDEVCFLPKTKVWTKNGHSNIEDDISEFNNSKIIQSMDREYSGEMIHIQPRFYSIGYTVTPEHPIWAIKRKQKYLFKKEQRIMPSKVEYYKIRYAKKTRVVPSWIKVKDLEVNDILVSPIPTRIINNKLQFPKEFLRLIGYYISEGSTGEHQIYLSFNSNESKFIQDSIYCVQKIFGKTPSVYKLHGVNCVNVSWSDKNFVNWLTRNCGKLAKNKHIPDFMMHLSDEQLEIVKSTIYDGDGYMAPDYKCLHVVSEKLVYQLLFFINSKGKIASLNWHKAFYLTETNKQKYGWVRDGFFYIPIYKISMLDYNGKVHNHETTTHSYTLPYLLAHNCVAEDKSEEGGKAVSAAMWQVTGKRVGRLDMASTAHFIHGTFYEYMMNPEKYGFKVYKWAIAKHVSGKKPLECYTDKNPSNWVSNVWWMSNADIQKMRKAKSNEEWLCESLGEASMASGAVFKKDDLDIVICKLCEECEPYNWDKCKLCKLASTGTPDDPTKYILDRRIGFDYGISESPTAVTIVGRKSDVVFVLFNDEQIGLREEDKVEWVNTNCQQWGTWDFIPDPAVGGKALNEKFEDLGYAVYVIPEQDKAERVYNLINFVEKHKIIIPNIFWHLTQSLRKCAWDSDGKIRKVDDHSFDSLCYSLVDWTVETESDIMSEFLNGSFKPKTKDLLK